MNSAITAAILFVCLAGVALLGRRVRRYLPEDHLSGDSKDAVKLALGLVATMTALLLRVLGLYGPEAAGARGELREAVADAVRRIWPEERSGPAQLAPNEQVGDTFYIAVQRLSPHDDTQRALKTQAATLMVEIGQLRSLLQAQSVPSISRPLLIAVVSWLVIIFLGFSLVAPPNTTTTLALVAAAFSVACAIFLILGLDHPFGGLIGIQSEPMLNALSHLAK